MAASVFAPNHAAGSYFETEEQPKNIDQGHPVACKHGATTMFSSTGDLRCPPSATTVSPMIAVLLLPVFRKKLGPRKLLTIFVELYRVFIEANRTTHVIGGLWALVCSLPAVEITFEHASVILVWSNSAYACR
jgi:hypothetical protein